MSMAATNQRSGEDIQVLEPFLAEHYERAKCWQFGLSAQQFVAILEEIAGKTVPAAATSSQRKELYAKLHLEDLVLARACAAGNEQAWEVFMLRFRGKLYDVAGFITKEGSSARELADSVYAELYGTRTRDGERVSKLMSYTGRGTLEGWLRTVLAQEFVNVYRKQRRLISLDEESEDGTQFAAPIQDSSAFADSRLETAIHDELRSLDVQDRFILASYFLDQRTLAEIGRALRMHESTISRKVEKLTRSLRKQIIKHLVRTGMDRAEAEDTLGADVRDLVVDVRASLAQDSVETSFSEKAAKAQEGGS
jgi:RNA polymerase sigma-70 factor (ECF subfamily)